MDETARPTPRCVAIRKCLVIGSALFGVLGLPFALLVGEPYPWLKMPGFYSAGGYDGETVSFVAPRFQFVFEDGTATFVTPGELFAGVPGSNYAQLTSRFLPERSAPPHSRYMPRGPFAGLQSDETWEPLDGDEREILQWFDERSSALYPRRVLDAVYVSWERRTIDHTGLLDVTAAESPTRFAP